MVRRVGLTAIAYNVISNRRSRKPRSHASSEVRTARWPASDSSSARSRCTTRSTRPASRAGRERVAPGDRLPTERDLAARYGCSLITVRRALGELVREGRLERTRGRGTFVLAPRFDRRLRGRAQLHRGDADPRASIRRRGCRRRPTGVGRRDRRRGAGPGARARRRSTSSASGWPTASRCCSSRSTCRPSASPGLLASDLEHGSLYDLLTERYGVRVARAREALEPVLLRAREARLLERKPGTPALLIEGIASTADGRPVEFGRTYVRGDRTRYYVERVVVRPRWNASKASEERGRATDSTRSLVVERTTMARSHGSTSDAGRPGGGASALVVAACGGTHDRAARRPASAGGDAARRPRPRPRAAAAGGVVEIRWFCCLGGGDAPEQVEVEQKVAEDFNASHPNIHLTFEAVPYARRPRRARHPDRRRATARTSSGPVGIGGAEAFHGQWLDLQPLIDKTGYDMSQFPESTVVALQRRRRGPGRHPVRGLPVGPVLQGRTCSRRPASPSRRTTGTATYTMPDGSTVAWDYDTVRKVAMLLTVDKNGKDATQAGFDPEKIVQWGFEPQRDDLRQTGAYWTAGSLVADDGKTAQIPDAWAAAWKWFYDGIWTDHFSMTGPLFQSTDFNPSGYPFFTGKVAMSENYLWSTYGVADAGDDWDLAAIPSYQGQTTAAFNADTFRILKDTKHPDEAFEVLHVPARRRLGDLLKTYGGMPARPSRAGRVLRDARRATITQTSTGRSPRRASSSPTSRTSSRSCRPTTSPSTCSARSGPSGRPRRVSTSTPRSGDLKTQLQAIWDAGRLTSIRWRPPASRAARQPRPPLSGLAWRRARWGYLFIAPWIIGFLAFTLFPMIATLVVHLHQHQPRPGGAAPVRRAAQLRDSCSATSRPGTRCGSRSSSPLIALPVAVIAAVRSSRCCSTRGTCGRWRCSGSCSSCPTSCRSWPAC